MQSFNRDNLKYEVRMKRGKKIVTELVNIIRSEFSDQSGIVYCLSRNECDQTAQELKRAGLQAEAYHAGLADRERASVQERWINEQGCKIICATIAFGMGIDKPDVRFVVHYTLPKSVEGYYQESGRAGRDGKLAVCILFYHYGDVARHRRLIESTDISTLSKISVYSRIFAVFSRCVHRVVAGESSNYETKRLHLDNLYRMVQYCENRTDCRRSQLLQYFSEIFDKSLCRRVAKATCDNCCSKVVLSICEIFTHRLLHCLFFHVISAIVHE